MITEPASWTAPWGNKRHRSKSEGQSRNTRYNQDKTDILDGPFKRSDKTEALFLNTTLSGDHRIDFDPSKDHNSEKLIGWFDEDYAKKGKKRQFVRYEDTPEIEKMDKEFKVRVNCIWNSKSSAISYPPKWIDTHVKTILIKRDHAKV